MKKTRLITACMAALGLMLGGCASGRGNVGATSVPTTPRPTATMGAMPTNSPEMSAAPLVSPNATMEANAGGMAAEMTPAQAGKLAEQISESVERLSEVEDAEVVLDTDRVLVAVEFEEQYKAGLDERMKEMITEKVREVDDRLTDVRITDDGTLYGQVKGLAQRMAKATGLDEMTSDFGDLWDRLTDM